METWKELKDRLGLPPAAAELVRRASAPARHEERIKAAMAAAKEGLSEEGIGAGRAIMRALAEVIGTGGHLGLGGEVRSSQRMGCFSHLGKGRAQATDGPAWSAALADALHRLAQEVPGWRLGPFNPGMAELPLAYRQAISGRALLILLGMPTPDVSGVIAFTWMHQERLLGTVEEWAKVYEEAAIP
jgi:hypothetical protein